MKKNILLKPLSYLLFSAFFSFALNAQEGPGGVGSASNNPFWFAADQMNAVTNNTNVGSWENIGGASSFTANQSNTNRRPTYLTNQINSFSALSFDGNDYLEIPDNNFINRNGPYNSRTFAMVIRTGGDVTTRQVIYEEGGAIRGLNIYIENGLIYFGGYNLETSDGSDSPWGYAPLNTSITANQDYILSFRFAGNSTKTGTITAYINGALIGNTLSNIGRLYNHNEAVIGAQNNDSYYHDGANSGDNKFHFTGLIAEFILYNKALNDSERITLENYLSSKYNKGLIATSDRNLNDLPTEGNFDFHSVGIARKNNVDSYLSSNTGTGVVAVQNNGLANGEYLMISSNSNNNTALSTASSGCSTNSKSLYRTETTWRASKSGNFTNTSFKLDIDDFGYTTIPFNDLQLEISTDPDFTGTTTTYDASSVNGSMIIFDNITFNNGDYIKFLLPAINGANTALPAGLSTLNNTKFWWRAESLNLSNNNPVTTWQNEGINPNNAIQNTSNSQPVYLEDQFNGYPALSFDGSNDLLKIAGNNDLNLGGPYSQRTFSIAFETSGDIFNKQMLYEEGGSVRNLHILIDNNELIIGGFNSPSADGPGSPWDNKQVTTSITANTRYVLSFVFEGNTSTTGSFTMHLNGANVGNVNGVGLLYAHNGDINIGGHTDNIETNGTDTSGDYFMGKIAEFVIHDFALSDYEVLLLQNYLGSKYDTDLGAAYINVYNTPAEGNFDHDLIAMVNAGNLNKPDSQFGTGIVRISNASDLGAGEYAFIAANNKEYTQLNVNDLNCSSPSTDNQKLNTVWRFGEFGNVGTLNLELALAQLNLPTAAYTNIELLVDDNPNFTSPTSISSSGIACETLNFNGVNFNGGDYFTFRINDLEPITWDGNQYLYGSGPINAPGIDDSGRKFIVNSGNPAVLEYDANVGCTLIDTGATLSVDAGINLGLNGNLTNAGTLDASQGSISMNGDALQSITGSDMSIGTLQVSNASGVNLNLDPNNSLRINSVLRVNQGGILNTNGDLTLACQFTDLSQRVAQVDDLSNGSINGEMLTEQCIPATRAFRFVTSPVTTTGTIRANWQEAATAWNVNPNPGELFGTHITGTLIDTQNGFDLTPSGNPSMFTFNNTAQSWNPIANTDATNLIAGTPYRLMVRGNRDTDITDNSATPSDAILRAMGTITSGTVNTGSDFSTTPGEFNFFGNPYPAAVDMSQVISDSNFTNLLNDYYIWDPNLSTRGMAVTIDMDAATPVPVPATSDANQFLQPGQAAFMATASAGTTPNIRFEESYKNVTTAQTAVFRPTNTANATGIVDINLYQTSAFLAQEPISDGVRIKFSNTYTTQASNEDASKFGNIDENIAVVNDGKYLAIDRRDYPQSDEVIPLFFNQYRSNQYSLQLKKTNLENYDFYIVDTYLQEEVLVSQEDFVFNFNLDADIPASIAPDRFEIRFESSLATPEVTPYELTVYPNPLKTEMLYLQLPTSLEGKLEVKAYDLLGKEVYNKQLIGTSRTPINLGQLTSGMYVLQVKHLDTGKVWNKKIIKE